MNMDTIASFGPIHKSQLFLPSWTNLFPVCKLSRFPLISFPGKPSKLVRLKAIATPICDVQEIHRTFQKVPPSYWDWGYHFLSVHVDVSEMDAVEIEIEALKPIVSGMLMSSQCVGSTKKRVCLIYLLVSLGLMYLFEDEIEESLQEDFEKIEDVLAGENDLHTISIIFWVFRTYGYNMSSEVFHRFKGENGKFKQCLVEDAKGMVSLFEAAHLGTPTDYIMDEALSFTTSKLESLATTGASSPPHITARIKNALCMPQHFNNEMVFTREYITFYEEEEDHNKMLLRFAKINFRFLQQNWIQELKTLGRWWKQQDFESKLPPYFRDRMTECFLYSLLTYFEPRFSRGRAAILDISTLVTLIDDTCDRYAPISEIADLITCVERWDPNSVDSLPDYMKTVFKCAWDVLEKCESEGRSEEGSSFNVQGLLEELKIYLRANLRFAEWAQTDVMPTTFDEYLEIGGVEVTMHISIAGTFLGLGKLMDRDRAYEWLKSRPKYVQAQAKRGRLMNDITGFYDDMSRGYKANAVNYYMKQYDVTEEEAFKELHIMVRELDKTVNEEFLKTAKKISRKILKGPIGFGKTVVFTYRTGEEFTYPERFKEHIISLFTSLIPL